MATESLSPRAAHRRSVVVTTVAALSGVAAGLVSSGLASGPSDQLGLLVMVGAIVVQLPLLGLLGVDVDEFGTKDHLYVAFMTFSLWFITWTILLSNDAALQF